MEILAPEVAQQPTRTAAAYDVVTTHREGAAPTGYAGSRTSVLAVIWAVWLRPE